MMYKLLNGKQPESFEFFFKKTPNFESDKNLRGFWYKVYKLKNQGIGKFPTAALPRSWNAIDQGLKLSSTLKSFKKDTYSSYIDKYKSNVKCHYRACPDCRPAH